MAQKETTPQHCPGYANFKNLKSFACNCPKCGEEKEIFSDEFERPHKCNKCGETTMNSIWQPNFDIPRVCRNCGKDL
jgi:ribosomal protein S27E